jgi:hypothetical protein
LSRGNEHPSPTRGDRTYAKGEIDDAVQFNQLSRDGAYEYTYDNGGHLVKRVALDMSEDPSGAATE